MFIVARLNGHENDEREDTNMRTGNLWNACRARDKAQKIERVKFVVVSLKKDGTPYKVMPADMLGRNACETFEQATARTIEMAKMNPGHTFTIVEVK